MEPGCAPMCPLSSSWPLTVGRLHSLWWKAWGCEIIQGRVCWFQGRHEAGCWDLLYWAERGWRQVALLDTISDSVLELALPQPGLAGLEVFREGAVSLWNLMPVNVGCTAQPVLTVVSNKWSVVSLFIHIKVTRQARVRVLWLWSMLVQAYNPSTQEAETGRSRVQG